MKTTLHDIRYAEQQIPNLKRESSYTAKKNAVSFELSLYDRKDRGEIVEHIISRKLDKLGIKNTVTENNAPHDIEFSGEKKKRSLRIEVKSALINQSSRYTYQNIKPNNFDYIFFAQVDPTKGLLIRWTTRRRIMNGVKRSGIKRHANGYSISMKIAEANKYGIELFRLDEFPWENGVLDSKSLAKHFEKLLKKIEKTLPEICNS